VNSGARSRRHEQLERLHRPHQPVLLDRGEDAVHVPAGVDDDGGLVVGVEQDRAVLLEGRDGNDPGVELSHGGSFCRVAPT
jgi:hypothetical protein